VIEFQWPWLLLAAPLPLLLLLLPRARPAEQAALRLPDLTPFANRGNGDPRRHHPLRIRSPLLIGLLAWLLLVGAAARPVWLGEALALPVSGRDLLLAVDISGSMQIGDFIFAGRQVSRLAATQQVAGEFIDRRVGDRLGLILFGREAYLQTPLTFDRKTVHQMLDEAAVGLAGKDTAIGDAIGLAIKRLANEPQESRVLVLLTDGANTAGEVMPVRAAQLAAAEGVTIHTIGLSPGARLVRSPFGIQRIDPSSDLDEKTLRTIAETTGGRYFRARDRAELMEIYQVIDQLEPVAKEQQMFRPQRSLYLWPLAAALLLATLLLWGQTRPRRAGGL